jgi:hypothetical protein
MRFRRSSLGRVYSGIRSATWIRSLSGPRGWAAVAGVAIVLTLVGVVVASVVPGSGARAAASGLRSSSRTSTASGQTGTVSGLNGTASGLNGRASGRTGTAARKSAPAAPGSTVTAATSTGATASGSRHAQPAAHSGSLGTSCRSVAHIGDSISVDLISSANLPDPAQQLPARYTDVGVKHLLMDASGGRSIVEALPGQVNGYNVAQAWWNQGYRGCWVFALGTNDTANVSVGSAVGLMGRINEMMSVAHGEPVLWVNTVTQLSSGSWSEANQQLWDSTLVSALARYPNMRILNWAAVAQPGWFLPDGIHYDQVGCAARAQAIADGLARAFPRYGHSHGQIVG